MGCCWYASVRGHWGDQRVPDDLARERAREDGDQDPAYHGPHTLGYARRISVAAAWHLGGRGNLFLPEKVHSVKPTSHGRFPS
jgi:hypothetical protein